MDLEDELQIMSELEFKNDVEQNKVTKIKKHYFDIVKTVYSKLKDVQNSLNNLSGGGGSQSIRGNGLLTFYANLLVKQFVCIPTSNISLKSVVKSKNYTEYPYHVIVNIGSGDCVEVITGLVCNFIKRVYCYEIDPSVESIRNHFIFKQLHTNKRIKLRVRDFTQVQNLPPDCTHIYSTAVVSMEFYTHIILLCCKHFRESSFESICITMFNHMWRSLGISPKVLLNEFGTKNVCVTKNIKLQGGGSQFQLVTLKIDSDVVQKLEDYFSEEED